MCDTVGVTGGEPSIENDAYEHRDTVRDRLVLEMIQNVNNLCSPSTSSHSRNRRRKRLVPCPQVVIAVVVVVGARYLGATDRNVLIYIFFLIPAYNNPPVVTKAIYDDIP